MITTIKFKNYKRFVEPQRIEIRPVTILVGRNSSGKSSISKLLPLLANATNGKIAEPFMFDNDGISVGASLSDVCHNGNIIGLSLGVEFNCGASFDAEFVTDATRQVIQISNYSIEYQNDATVLKLKGRDSYESNEGRDVSYSTRDFRGLINLRLIGKYGLSPHNFATLTDYIGPFRCLPERTIYSKGKTQRRRVGIKGELAYQVLCHDKDVREKVSEWYEEAFDGCSLKVERAGEGIYGAYHINMYKKNSDFGVNIVEEGQGMSQVLPIVVRANMMVKDSIVVVEQPELHLHPKAHASIAKLLAITSKETFDDGQPVNQHYLIETHSENILLGIRDAVVDKTVDFGPDDVIIYFVQERNDGTSQLRPITIDQAGELSSWPTGVFNEAYELLRHIHEKAEQ